jgi:4-amino-4-deoxy-L-arabinose transferase-like glycosyltransferase
MRPSFQKHGRGHSNPAECRSTQIHEKQDITIETTGRKNELWGLIFLLGLCYLLFFHNLGLRNVWSPDEDEYVLVNIEMVHDGHWIYPTANGAPYSIKPPLYNWIGSLISVVYGEVNEFTSRLPSSLAALIGILLVYYLGRVLFGYRAGLISAMVLATSPLYIEFARWIQINMTSTMLLTATLFLFYLGYSDPRKRPWAYMLMYVPMGIGTLNMGPVNLVMPVIVIGIYLLVMKDPKHILQLKIGWGILIYLLVVGPWYVTVCLRESYAKDLLFTTNVTRFFGNFMHVRPFYYYFKTTPPHFLPWLVFLPVAFYLCFSKKTREDRKRLQFPFAWAVSLFVFFSPSNTKRAGYILPIFPALALLVGFMLDRALLQWKDSTFWRKSLFRPTYALLGCLGLTALGIALYCIVKALDWLGLVLPIVIVMAAGVTLGFVLLRKERVFETLVTAVMVLAVVVAYGSGPVIVKANGINSAKSFCLKLNERIPEGENLKMFRFYRAMYPVYTRRFVEVIMDPSDLLDWFRQDKQVYVVTTEEIFGEIKDTFEAPIHVIVRQWIEHRYMLLLSNRTCEYSTLEDYTTPAFSIR